ncbi:DUF2065 domain-containing protein [Candidatus Aminicenantes bacterium AC-708-M15]|jgi:hypothetical protein|nr:DUF2065 domain-containing protein [SCandidatus Aminicenantes bacterium Aminicenantia_JdfR_composite]MCP2596493.1 DUF2065 domain-containing protein [Candidatus Aminicenantes bacterium AC-335-G13]MCP2603888.1 DUF2065 domain-containing protein [Candidatus Aminicenantes bacterium AC-708-M15]MCP2618087.1 DUF2065 domain-containing protein [Candidatus Aminicenantes bacterium AC-335-A11]
MKISLTSFDFYLLILGIYFVLEGLPYFLFPQWMKKRLALIMNMKSSSLRWMGFLAMCVGILLVFLVKRG